MLENFDIFSLSIKDILLECGGVVGIVFTILQVSKIEINPWTWVAKTLGRALNEEVIDKVDSIETQFNEQVTSLEHQLDDISHDVQNLRNVVDENEASNCRIRILRFGDEILHGVSHSKEHFDQVLVDITNYENFCKSHPDFKNNIADATIRRIKQVYDERLEENDFS